MSTPEQSMVDYNEVFDKLIHEITTAQAELDLIQEQLKNQRSTDSVGLEAATLQEETKLWKKETPDGFVEDDKIMYYLAVGQVEELVKEMTSMKELSGMNLAATKSTLATLKKSIREQDDLVKSLESELVTNDDVSAEEEVSQFNLVKRRELNDNIRKNKMIVKEMKTDLKAFIDETAKLDPDFNPADGSACGYLLQVLWKNFLDNPGEYISIQALDFDVPEAVLQQLLGADIVMVHPSNPDLIKMTDFTMSS